MKKIIGILAVLLLVGCTDLSNTPTKRVETFFKKYQTLDKVVITDLDATIAKDTTLTENQKTIYRDIMKKHYQNLKYDIKEESMNGDKAMVTVEIEVTDFKKVKDETTAYLAEHTSEFNNDKGEYDVTLYNNYRLEQLKKATEKVKYTLNLSVTKSGKEWTLDTIASSIYDKINGIYNY